LSSILTVKAASMPFGDRPMSESSVEAFVERQPLIVFPVQ